MKFLYLFLFGMTFMSDSRAETITRFKAFRFMQPGQDLTHQSDVNTSYLVGYGTVSSLTFFGATCGMKANVLMQQAGLYVRDEHVDLLDGELSEQNGIVYICSSQAPPQVQQQQQPQIKSSH